MCKPSFKSEAEAENRKEEAEKHMQNWAQCQIGATYPEIDELTYMEERCIQLVAPLLSVLTGPVAPAVVVPLENTSAPDAPVENESPDATVRAPEASNGRISCDVGSKGLQVAWLRPAGRTHKPSLF